jgi:hypothetical protein
MTTLVETPTYELGVYDEDENTSGWTFEELYADHKWQELDMHLRGGT